MSEYSAGPSTSEAAKVSPMEPPIMAMALVRCSSRVRSASSAVTAALMAPAPLDTATDNNPVNIVRNRGNQAAQREQRQAEIDHALAPEVVRGHAETAVAATPA